MPGRNTSASQWVGLGVVLAVTVLALVLYPRVRGDLTAARLQQDRLPGDLRVGPRPPDDGQWKFIEKQGSRPVAYDPCRSIHYVVRVGRGPLNGTALVQGAIERLSAATGLTFVSDGMTTDVPQWDDIRGADQPVWIGWADETETDMWTHAVDGVGVGGSEVATDGAGRQVFVTGFAVLRPDNRLPPVFGAGENEGTVLLHELGHVVGLDHVSDPRETMYSEVSHFTGDGYGPGDLRGLWALGASQGCL